MADDDFPRVRFAKREIAKALEALERVDGGQINAAMRLLQVEDELADAREMAARWRRAYEELQVILAGTVTAAAEHQVEQLDEAMRVWVAKA